MPARNRHWSRRLTPEQLEGRLLPSGLPPLPDLPPSAAELTGGSRADLQGWVSAVRDVLAEDNTLAARLAALGQQAPADGAFTEDTGPLLAGRTAAWRQLSGDLPDLGARLGQHQTDPSTLAQAAEVLTRLEADVRARLAQLPALRDERARLEGERAALAEAIEGLAGRQADVAARIAEHASRRDELQRSLDASTGRRDQLARTRADLADRAAALTPHLAVAEDALRQGADRMQSAARAVQDAEGAVSALVDRVAGRDEAALRAAVAAIDGTLAVRRTLAAALSGATGLPTLAAVRARLTTAAQALPADLRTALQAGRDADRLALAWQSLPPARQRTSPLRLQAVAARARAERLRQALSAPVRETLDVVRPVFRSLDRATQASLRTWRPAAASATAALRQTLPRLEQDRAETAAALTAAGRLPQARQAAAAAKAALRQATAAHEDAQGQADALRAEAGRIAEATRQAEAEATALDQTLARQRADVRGLSGELDELRAQADGLDASLGQKRADWSRCDGRVGEVDRLLAAAATLQTDQELLGEALSLAREATQSLALAANRFDAIVAFNRRLLDVLDAAVRQGRSEREQAYAALAGLVARPQPAEWQPEHPTYLADLRATRERVVGLDRAVASLAQERAATAAALEALGLATPAEPTEAADTAALLAADHRLKRAHTGELARIKTAETYAERALADQAEAQAQTDIAAALRVQIATLRPDTSGLPATDELRARLAQAEAAAAAASTRLKADMKAILSVTPATLFLSADPAAALSELRAREADLTAFVAALDAEIDDLVRQRPPRGDVLTASALETARTQAADLEARIAELRGQLDATISVTQTRAVTLTPAGSGFIGDHQTTRIGDIDVEVWSGWERYGLTVKDGRLMTVGDAHNRFGTAEAPLASDHLGVKFAAPVVGVSAVRLGVLDPHDPAPVFVRFQGTFGYLDVPITSDGVSLWDGRPVSSITVITRQLQSESNKPYALAGIDEIRTVATTTPVLTGQARRDAEEELATLERTAPLTRDHVAYLDALGRSGVAPPAEALELAGLPAPVLPVGPDAPLAEQRDAVTRYRDTLTAGSAAVWAALDRLDRPAQSEADGPRPEALGPVVAVLKRWQGDLNGAVSWADGRLEEVGRQLRARAEAAAIETLRQELANHPWQLTTGDVADLESLFTTVATETYTDHATVNFNNLPAGALAGSLTGAGAALTVPELGEVTVVSGGFTPVRVTADGGLGTGLYEGHLTLGLPRQPFIDSVTLRKVGGSGRSAYNLGAGYTDFSGTLTVPVGGNIGTIMIVVYGDAVCELAGITLPVQRQRQVRTPVACGRPDARGPHAGERRRDRQPPRAGRRAHPGEGVAGGDRRGGVAGGAGSVPPAGGAPHAVRGDDRAVRGPGRAVDGRPAAGRRRRHPDRGRGRREGTQPSAAADRPRGSPEGRIGSSEPLPHPCHRCPRAGAGHGGGQIARRRPDRPVGRGAETPGRPGRLAGGRAGPAGRGAGEPLGRPPACGHRGPGRRSTLRRPHRRRSRGRRADDGRRRPHRVRHRRPGPRRSSTGPRPARHVAGCAHPGCPVGRGGGGPRRDRTGGGAGLRLPPGGRAGRAVRADVLSARRSPPRLLRPRQ